MAAGGDRATGGSGLVAILFTDLVGSTELATKQGDVAADALRRDHFSHLREALASTGGIEIKTIGDALMASFASASGVAADGVAGMTAGHDGNVWFTEIGSNGNGSIGRIGPGPSKKSRGRYGPALPAACPRSRG